MRRISQILRTIFEKRKRTPDFLEVELILPDSQMCVYRVPTVKVEHYTKDSIFEKKLLMLLPFYIMRYEKSADIIEKDSENFRDY